MSARRAAMNATHLQYLVCPKTLAPLRAEVTEGRGEGILEGHLSAGGGHRYPIRGGIPGFVPADVLESQTVRSFSRKWANHKYYREHTEAFYTDWYLNRYGFFETAELRAFLEGKQFILDAGTGAGRDAANFARHSSATVFAVDTAREALDVAASQINDPRIGFIQADLNELPFADGFFDFISCDQVIHHTPDPRAAFEHLRRKLKTGGVICCYVYKKKAPAREFTDEHVRRQISELPFEEALSACEGITRLGQTLANLDITLNIEQDIPVLGIRKGPIDLQRFIHWNMFKCFWNDEFDFFTNNIVNVDWYHPQHCHRFDPAEFRAWFADGWEIQAWDVQDAGISCRARKI